MTRSAFQLRKRHTGSSLIEVLVTMTILSIGLLGLVGLMVQSQRSEVESYQRVQALVLLDDMVNRINANRTASACYAFTDFATGVGYVGTGATYAFTTACSTATLVGPQVASLTSAQKDALAATVNTDIKAWSDLLLGTSEQLAAGNVGAMLGARGCVDIVDATNRVYRVSVVWQGSYDTFSPQADNLCGKGLYGSETLRRVVSASVQVADLTPPPTP